MAGGKLGSWSETETCPGGRGGEIKKISYGEKVCTERF